MTSIRHALLLILVLTALTLLLRYAPPPPEKKMNVVIISIDSLRADHMGLYGYGRDTTPFLDAYARTGAVFENYFSTSAITPISEGSVQTGMYPVRSGLINFSTTFSSETRTIAETLRENGWRTAAFGSSPEFSGGPLKAGFSRGFDAYSLYKDFDSDPSTNTSLEVLGMTVPSIEALDSSASPSHLRRNEVPVEEAAAWIRDGDPEKPFYLWLSAGSVHWPYGSRIPDRFSSSAYDGFLDAERYAANPANSSVAVFQGLYGRIYDGALYDDTHTVITNDLARDVAHLVDTYDDGVYYTDQKLAPLLALLSSPQYRGNTIVILESEHGEDLGDHGYVAHYDVLGTQTHVPLIIWAPNMRAGRVPSLASGVDIAPTLYDLLGLSHETLDGVSLAGAMAEGAPSRDVVFLTRTPLWERILAEGEPWLHAFKERDTQEHFYDTAVRDEKWLLIHRRSRDILNRYSWYGHLTGKAVVLSEYELYDIPNDPLELHDVYAENASKVRTLRDRLLAWEVALETTAPAPQAQKEVQPYF